jgi:lysine 2,3-aminomutase
VTGMTDELIYFKYAQAADDENLGRFMAFGRNREAVWFDDYDDLRFSEQIS